ncbi:uncharacterized protein LAJ45_04173 [Morchella importuna]|uniref:uncharacterized protein n=1 Tax=Morchella importuna TaxID=1174673 RepID=UPI001E8DEBC2|nr:uncharacterized protein LAJ45_04173 [Morchella importuna]KAH8151552.1 hypothetical protein LAJ45_04173 [Morchella importuna]
MAADLTATTATTTTTTTATPTTTTTTAANNPPMVNAPTTTTAEPPTASQKRKRSTSSSAAMKGTDDPAGEKRKMVWDQIMKDLAVVLKEHDTHPSVLTTTISPPSSSSSDTTDGTPPIKRAKLSPHPPSTIASRLASGTYTTPAALLSDIAAICHALDAPTTAPSTTSRTPSSRANVPAAPTSSPARTSRQPPPPPRPPTARNSQVPIPSSERLSRSPSASESSPAASTAPTSTCASPKTAPTKVVRVVAPLNEAALPPLISTVKAASNPLKRDAPEDPKKVPTLGEAFPPVRISSLAPPKAGAAGVVGLKWGGVMGPGGVAVVNGASARAEPAGEWLLYRNHPPRTAKWRAMARGEPVRQGMGLPAEVVAAYSSFAPVRDDAGAKVPAGVRGRVWWERMGREMYREMFGAHPGVGHMFREKEEEEEGKRQEAGDVVMSEAVVGDGEDEEEMFRKAVESFEPDQDVPVDFRLLEGAEKEGAAEKKEDEEGGAVEVAGVNADETLKEISNLLKRLQSHQYIRLSTAPTPPAPRITTTNTPSTSTSTATAPAPPSTTTSDTPTTPTPEELTLYNDIHTRLTHLISTLPPHATITIDGTPTAPLTISALHPLTSGTPIYTGTLPSTPPAPPAAALAALNAAVGMSPSSASSPAPIAMMSRTAPPPRLQGAPNVQTYYTPQQYHGHQLPAATMPHHYPSPYAPPPPRVVSPGVSRVGQPMFHAHSMPAATVPAPGARRVGVPQPMGLAAIGAGYGGGGGYGVQSGGGGVQGGVQGECRGREAWMG